MQDSKKSSKNKSGKGTKKKLPKMGITVRAPVSAQLVVRKTEPVINRKQGVVTIRHRELIKDIMAQSGENLVDTFVLNPGSGKTFPWLSVVCSAFEMYRFKSIKFTTVTRAATSATGSLILAFDPDTQDQIPGDIAEFGGYRRVVEQPIWKDASIHLSEAELNNIGPRKAIRDPGSGGSDLSDAGQVFVLTEAADGLYVTPTTVARAWIDYEVELYDPTSEKTLPYGGSFELVGTVAQWDYTSNTKGVGNKGIEWKYVGGDYQGPLIENPGMYIVFARQFTTGGGTVSDMALLVRSGSASTAEEMNAFIGATDSFTCWRVTCFSGNVQLNFVRTTSGTITSILSDVFISMMPPLSNVAMGPNPVHPVNLRTIRCLEKERARKGRGNKGHGGLRGV